MARFVLVLLPLIFALAPYVIRRRAISDHDRPDSSLNRRDRLPAAGSMSLSDCVT